MCEFHQGQRYPLDDLNLRPDIWKHYFFMLRSNFSYNTGRTIYDAYGSPRASYCYAIISNN